ncbi:hypothetical protein T265_11511 [Opisthorchis viverrini]|uniref:Legumain n=1 Tax=Opisthorchis viverrini TaxID=6198 RepID=A0A074Z2R3_OPIVI|nr:hypothetical protein T265_11511 [Opisthorchis viverrini]KER19802.1 hypothetical protein T265_11511 [Opisthorchis viverrini]
MHPNTVLVTDTPPSMDDLTHCACLLHIPFLNLSVVLNSHVICVLIQADVYHAYKVVRANKVPAENIITFAYDDIANNPKNPFKGKVFHEYQHEDVYNGVVIDYRGKDVTRDNFVKVLKGDDKLEANQKKVLKRVFSCAFLCLRAPAHKLLLKTTLYFLPDNGGPNDNVFVFYSGHGGTSHIYFLNKGISLVNFAHEKFSSCLATAVRHGVERYPRLHAFKTNVQQIGAIRGYLQIGLYISRRSSFKYGYSPLSLSPTRSQKDTNKRTLEQQYEEVKKSTVFSHVMKYGEMAMGSLPVGKFHGHYDLLIHRNGGGIAPNSADRKPSCKAHLFSKSRRMMQAATEGEHEIAWQRLHKNPIRKDAQEICNRLCTTSHKYSSRFFQLGLVLRDTFRDIVVDVTTHHKPTLKSLSKRDELMCFKEVFDQFRTHCLTIQQATEILVSICLQVPEVAQHTTHLMELCKAGYEVGTLIDSVHNVCS